MDSLPFGHVWTSQDVPVEGDQLQTYVDEGVLVQSKREGDTLYWRSVAQRTDSGTTEVAATTVAAATLVAVPPCAADEAAKPGEEDESSKKTLASPLKRPATATSSPSIRSQPLKRRRMVQITPSKNALLSASPSATATSLTPLRRKVTPSTVGKTPRSRMSDIMNSPSLATSRRQLQQRLLKREDVLRKLKLVRTYRTQNNLEKLRGLTDKWRNVTQEALQRLHAIAVEQQPTITLGELVDAMHIERALVGYCEEYDDFS